MREGYALLFSTNNELDPKKSTTTTAYVLLLSFCSGMLASLLGLEHCQAREEDKLRFHFNFVFLILILAKWEILQSGKSSIYMDDLKSEYFNRNYLQMIFAMLDL
jgi:hypothetical protein